MCYSCWLSGGSIFLLGLITACQLFWAKSAQHFVGDEAHARALHVSSGNSNVIAIGKISIFRAAQLPDALMYLACEVVEKIH